MVEKSMATTVETTIPVVAATPIDTRITTVASYFPALSAHKPGCPSMWDVILDCTCEAERS